MKSSFAAILSLQFALIACLSLSTQQVDAAVKWPHEYVNDAKNFLLDLFKDRVLSRSAIVAHFEETMDIVKTRYAAAEKRGELDNLDENEKQSFYYKLVVEETRLLRERVEAEKSVKSGSQPMTTQAPIDLANLPEQHKEILEKLEIDQLKDDAEEDLLVDELNKIETEEAEMGFSMSPEARAALKIRTKQVMTDLMSNEMKQLAMAIMTSYFTGGPISGTITTAVIASTRFKLVDYLINIVVDILSHIMGRDIQISPVMPQGQASVKDQDASQQSNIAPEPKNF